MYCKCSLIVADNVWADVVICWRFKSGRIIAPVTVGVLGMGGHTGRGKGRNLCENDIIYTVPFPHSVQRYVFTLVLALTSYHISPDIWHMNNSIHSENTPFQIYWKFHHQKTERFQIKILIFFIFAQNIDCRYSLEPPRRGGSNEYQQSMFWAEICKMMHTPVNPRFTI